MSLMDTIRRGLVTALRHHGAEPADAAETAETILQWLCLEEGGREHYLPAVVRQSKNRVIAAALASGKTARQAAVEAGVSERQAYRVKRSMGSPTWDLQDDAAQARRGRDG